MNEILLKYAAELKISDTGVCKARVYDELGAILTAYKTPFTAAAEKRISPFDHVPNASSVIMCVFNYYMGSHEGNLSKYVYGTDYHTVIRAKLSALCDRLEGHFGAFSRYIFCDTSPLCDKYLAYLSGLGFFGDNHLLIHPVYGSYIFIGGIVTDLELEYNEPLGRECAHCGKCAEMCPGGVFDGGFDIFKCASYLQQKKGELSEQQKEIIRRCGNVWGCDVCSDVCTHNKNVPVTDIDEFKVISSDLPRTELENFGSENSASYNRAFTWRGRRILERNLDILDNK